MSDSKEMTLLRELFKATRAEPHGVSRRGFLAKHPNDVEKVERLIAAGEVQYRDGKHLRLPLLGLIELATVMPEAESVRYLCSHLFGVLRAAFIDSPDGKLSVPEIAVLADMPEKRVATAFEFLLDAPIFESWSSGPGGSHFDIVLSDRILKYQAFDDVVEAMRAQRQSTQSQPISYTDEASRAVYEAIENLTAAGQRAYVRSVPLAAENVLIERGGGRIQRVDANSQIQAAIVGLSQEEKIAAFVEPHRDWVINEPLKTEASRPPENLGNDRGAVGQGMSSTHSYVDPARLHELKTVSSKKWDLTRLVRMCEELNEAFERDAFITCSMLVRSIVDHVPPIFDCKSFSEVANNYAGSKSFRGSMQHIDKSLRNHADGNLHTQIRRKESLPTQTQVAFWSDLDKLLEETIRLLKDDRS